MLGVHCPFLMVPGDMFMFIYSKTFRVNTLCLWSLPHTSPLFSLMEI